MAASLGNFYIDGPTLATATVVYTDVDLTICAPDGFYSDGVVVRQQINCTLSFVQNCPSCGVPCTTTVNANGTAGIYELTFDTGVDLGAMIIYFDPIGVPDGIRGIFDGVTYNAVTSPQFGYLASPSVSNFVVLGQTGSDCNPPIGQTLDQGGYTGLDEYRFNSVTNVYDQIGTSGTVTGASSDVNLTAGQPGDCTMVIPRPNYNANQCIIEVGGFCGTQWDLQINCPVVLTATPISVVGDDCGTTNFPNFVYVAPNINGTPGEPAVNEFAFGDGNGELKYIQGQYIINPPSGPKSITVSSDGVISNIVNCP